MPRKRSNPDVEACASTPRKSARLTHRKNPSGHSTELADKLDSLEEFWEEEAEWAAKQAEKDYLLQMPKKNHKYVNKNGVKLYDDRYVQEAKKQVDDYSSDVEYKCITPPPEGVYIPLAGIPKTAPSLIKWTKWSLPKSPPGEPPHLYLEDPEDQQMEEAVPARDIPQATVEATFDGVSDNSLAGMPKTAPSLPKWGLPKSPPGKPPHLYLEAPEDQQMKDAVPARDIPRPTVEATFVGTSAVNVAETLQKAAKMPSQVVKKKSPKRSVNGSSPTPRKTSKSPVKKTVKSPVKQTLQKTIRKTSPKTAAKDVKKTVEKAVEKLSVENVEPVVAAPRKVLKIIIKRSNNQLSASLAPAQTA
ncbi:hypothetical protein V8F33_000635 [Rhypophila sp. PSN 637]